VTAPLTLWLALAAATSTSSAAASAPTIELVTLAPGDALYSLWGHSAIRVIERDPTRDVAYNFGSIDFSGDVWARMLTGHVEAYVVSAPYHLMARVYRDEGRSIVRRPLALRPDEARGLADALAARAKGAASRYRYHHFEDNCATQVADMIDEAVGGALSAATSSVAQTTVRALALEPIRHRALLYVVVDTLLTGAVDRPMPRWDITFLPWGIEQIVDTVPHPQGGPLAAPPIVDFMGHREADRGQWTWPWVKVYLLFVLPLLAVFVRFPRAGAAIWCLVAGAAGVLVTLGWAATTYDFLADNWNVLVLPPTHLLALAVVLRGRWLERPRLRLLLSAYAVGHLVTLAALTAGRITGTVDQAIDPMLGLALGPALAMVLRRPRAAS